MKPAKRKLSVMDVMEIRESARKREELRQRAGRLSNSALAERFGVHQRNIEKILRGDTWGWLE